MLRPATDDLDMDCSYLCHQGADSAGTIVLSHVIADFDVLKSQYYERQELEQGPGNTLLSA